MRWCVWLWRLVLDAEGSVAVVRWGAGAVIGLGGGTVVSSEALVLGVIVAAVVAGIPTLLVVVHRVTDWPDVVVRPPARKVSTDRAWLESARTDRQFWRRIDSLPADRYLELLPEFMDAEIARYNSQALRARRGSERSRLRIFRDRVLRRDAGDDEADGSTC